MVYKFKQGWVYTYRRVYYTHCQHSTLTQHVLPPLLSSLFFLLELGIVEEVNQVKVEQLLKQKADDEEAAKTAKAAKAATGALLNSTINVARVKGVKGVKGVVVRRKNQDGNSLLCTKCCVSPHNVRDNRPIPVSFQDCRMPRLRVYASTLSFCGPPPRSRQSTRWVREGRR